MKTSTLIVILILFAVGIFAYVQYENRSPAEKAIDNLKEAGRDLKDAVDPRSPAEKFKDGVKDTVNDLKK